MCSDNPVLLVLEDLHWADKPSLLLLRHVIASTDPSRLLVVGTYRPTDLGAEHPLTDVLAALHREQHVQRVDLRGLNDAEVVALLEAAAGHSLDDEPAIALAHALYRETDGNPFFTRRDPATPRRDRRHLSARRRPLDRRSRLPRPNRAAHQRPGGHRTPRRPPRRGDRTRYCARLPSSVATSNSTCSPRSPTTARSTLLDLLDGAIRAVLIREVPQRPGRLSFSHALIEHTLYDDLGPTRRQRLHLRVAAALETLCGDDPGDRVGELAYHWAQASPTCRRR